MYFIISLFQFYTEEEPKTEIETFIVQFSKKIINFYTLSYVDLKKGIHHIILIYFKKDFRFFLEHFINFSTRFHVPELRIFCYFRAVSEMLQTYFAIFMKCFLSVEIFFRYSLKLSVLYEKLIK